MNQRELDRLIEEADRRVELLRQQARAEFLEMQARLRARRIDEEEAGR
jgi:hypothetical protein